jgi:hypothetical protein
VWASEPGSSARADRSLSAGCDATEVATLFTTELLAGGSGIGAWALGAFSVLGSVSAAMFCGLKAVAVRLPSAASIGRATVTGV